MKVKQGCDAGAPCTTEDDLLKSKEITPEDVLGLQKITDSKFSNINDILKQEAFENNCTLRSCSANLHCCTFTQSEIAGFASARLCSRFVFYSVSTKLTNPY